MATRRLTRPIKPRRSRPSHRRQRPRRASRSSVGRMEPRFVQASGLRFGYLEQGQGPLVLLVHGFPDTAYTWDRTMAAVAGAGFRAVAPFTRGYHPTEIPPDGPFDSETLGRDLLA